MEGGSIPQLERLGSPVPFITSQARATNYEECTSAWLPAHHHELSPQLRLHQAPLLPKLNRNRKLPCKPNAARWARTDKSSQQSNTSASPDAAVRSYVQRRLREKTKVHAMGRASPDQTSNFRPPQRNGRVGS